MSRVVRMIAFGLGAGGLVLPGCARQEKPEVAVVEEAPAVEPAIAVATLQSREDLTITGHVSFTQTQPGGAVTIAAHIEGAVEGLHGFHVHEIGNCSAEDFTSAGGHFNPAEVPHGGPGDAERHAGDLGNLEVGQDGVGHLQIDSNLLTIEGGPASVVGRAVILHEKMDDLVSQPTGAAGSRLACGVIELEP